MKPVLLPTIAASLAVLATGCKPASSTPTKTSSPPAKVVTENDLASIVLTADAERRLGITTVPLEVKKVERSRALAGELLLPLGRTDGASNADAVSGRSIYSLLPAMTPSELIRVGELQVEADGGVATAQVELDAARVALERAQNLVANSAGTQRAMDEARARVQQAEAALETARKRRALLGAPLFDAIRKDVLWVRVSVYAGDLNQINRAAPASVSSLGANSRESSRTARPVAVPFSPSAAPATVDLFYELNNADGKLRPGEKVSANVPLQGETESSVVPSSAVLYDIHGGAWVYENTAPETFTRRRIEVRFISDGNAVLARGPAPGAKIVTAGAAELFGVEFGFGK
jgi:hypothetical protein